MAHDKIKEVLKPGDIVLVKGSNGMHLINIVDDIKTIYGSEEDE